MHGMVSPVAAREESTPERTTSQLVPPRTAAVIGYGSVWRGRRHEPHILQRPSKIYVERT
jgi:hypothetical protein